MTPHVNHRIMARLIPSARLHTVKGGGHLALLDSAHEVGPVITAFLHGASERPAAEAEAAAASRLTCFPAAQPGRNGGSPT